jgi:signal transduction histidine kinase
MSHELRTPLNAIIGFSELIEGQAFGEIGNTRYREYAGDIRESGQHLLALINDILDLSKVESGSVEPKDEIFEVEKVLRSCVALVSERARNNGVDIEVNSLAASPLMLRADRRMFKQILSNLLSNAVKFTPAAGRITVAAHVDDRAGLAIEVRDTGIGMAEKDIPKALTRFGQVESHLDRKYEGTGLGLPLVKSLIELHGGLLDLRSELHRGTCATVVFPPERIVEPKSAATGTSGA